MESKYEKEYLAGYSDGYKNGYLEGFESGKEIGERATCELEEKLWNDCGESTWGVICSNCSDRHEHETGTIWNYCPTCGAEVVR